jgi:hypothetical protein
MNFPVLEEVIRVSLSRIAVELTYGSFYISSYGEKQRGRIRKCV